MESVKQVIVIRKDLGMRRGKEIAQGAHASMIWICDRIERSMRDNISIAEHLSDAQEAWLLGSFKKICVVVNSEEELEAVLTEALRVGLVANLVTDAGLTEFNGIPTKTCIAIGPDFESKIDPVCKHLKLY